ncbi:MAG: T9SS type A sorting domain-containing protein [Chitinophagaceae bacterium]|nr:T9SS type A sorting domain-containing protein [Chitinophagaceae bacterium]
MKTYIPILYSLFATMLLVPMCIMAQGIINTSGTQLVVDGAACIVINDGGFTNNGTFSKSTGSVVFSGSTATANSFIAGTTTTDFYNLTLNKSANGLQLNRNIGVSNLVTFTSGDSIFLNTYNVDLGSNGSLSGETSSKRFTGQTGGYIMITQSLNAPSAVNPGNLGMEITSAANLGSTVIKRAHTVYRDRSVTRNFDITPTNNAALNATLVFNYFHSELRTTIESTLSTYSSSNGGTNWFYISGGPDLNTISNYITSTNVNSLHLLSLFSLADLPVHLLYLKGKAINRSALLEWATSGEIDNDYFDVERSANGITFLKIGTVKGSGNTSIQKTYQYTDEHPLTGTNYYRIKQVDTNLDFMYSGIVSVQITEPAIGISLSPNPATNLLFVKINGLEADEIDLKLMDQHGKIYKFISLKCKKGENNFTINIEDLPKGLYYINLSGKNNQSVKFLKM